LIPVANAMPPHSWARTSHRPYYATKRLAQPVHSRGDGWSSPSHAAHSISFATGIELLQLLKNRLYCIPCSCSIFVRVGSWLRQLPTLTTFEKIRDDL
jgi:hypothetical protein